MKKKMNVANMIMMAEYSRVLVPFGPYYKPIYTGATEYVRGNERMRLSAPEGPEKSQMFRYVYQNGKMLVEGKFFVNAYTGKCSRPLILDCVNAPLNMAEIVKQFTYSVIHSMGAVNYTATRNPETEKPVKPQNATIRFTEAPAAIAMAAGLRIEPEMEAEAAQDTHPWKTETDKSKPETDELEVREQEAHVLSWEIPMTWCKANPEYHYTVPTRMHHGVLQYQRRAFTCRRHLRKEKEE